MVENLYFQKTLLQDLLSSLNAVISTNVRTRFIPGHMVYIPGLYLNLTDDNHQSKGKMVPKFDLGLLKEYKVMYYDRNTNGNKDGKILESNKWVLCNQHWIPFYQKMKNYFAQKDPEWQFEWTNPSFDESA